MMFSNSKKAEGKVSIFAGSRDVRSLLRAATISRSELQFCVSGQTRIVSPHAGAVSSVDVDKIHHNFALFGGSDGKVSLFDLRPAFKSFFRVPCRIERLSVSGRGHAAATTGVQWFPKDCGAFISSSYDGSIKLWETETFAPVVDFNFPGHVNCFKMHHDGKLVGCGIDGNDIRLCDLRTGGSTHVFSAHRKAVTSIDFCASNSHIMASSSLDKSVKIFDVRKGSTKAVLLSLDWRQEAGKRTAVRGSDLSSSIDWQHDGTAIAHDGGAMSLTFSSCGAVLVTSGADRCVRSWDPATGTMLCALSNTTTDWNTSAYQIELSSTLPGISNDDILLFPGKIEGSIGMTVIDKQKGFSFDAPVLVLRGHMRTVRGIKYIPGRNKILSVGSDGLMLLWEPQTPCASSCASFTGPDPREAASVCSNAQITDGRLGTGLDADNWSDAEDLGMDLEESGRSDTHRVEASLSRVRAGNRFLPPIIRQILDEEQRSSSHHP